MLNLDGMDSDELREKATAFKHLSRYANYKRVAGEFRAQGNIKMAQEYERNCDELYKLLPDWARW